MNEDVVAPGSGHCKPNNASPPQTRKEPRLAPEEKCLYNVKREQEQPNAGDDHKRAKNSGNDTDFKIHGDEEAPESQKARIERLGRERPAKFKSFGAELAFCYSIIASQFMAVSSGPNMRHSQPY